MVPIRWTSLVCAWFHASHVNFKLDIAPSFEKGNQEMICQSTKVHVSCTLHLCKGYTLRFWATIHHNWHPLFQQLTIFGVDHVLEEGLFCHLSPPSVQEL